MKLMSIKERTILIIVLLLLIGIICTVCAAFRSDDVENIETVSFETITESTEPQIVKRKVEKRQNLPKNKIIMFETATEETTEIVDETTEIVDKTTEVTTEVLFGSETTETTDTTADTTAASYEGIPVYAVNGAVLDPKLQEYAYACLAMLDIGFYYQTFLCQMYQESRFDQGAVSPWGDYGLCQLKGKYHDYFKQLAGIPEADLVNDPYSNIYVGAFLMAHYYKQCWDVNTAISTYNTGTFDAYNAEYVAQVRQWESTLTRR